MTSPQNRYLYGLAVCLCFLLAGCGTSTSYSSGQPADPPPFYAEKPDLPPTSTEKAKAEETAKQALLEEPQESKAVPKAVKTAPAKQETKAATAKTATKVAPPPKAQIKTTTKTTAKTAEATKAQTAIKRPVVSPVPDSNTLPPYRLQVGDVLRIRLLLNPELDEDVIVRPDGMISTALVQNLQAYGLTPLELQKSLIKYYKQQLTDPRISVIVQSFAPTRVYVLGEVKAPVSQFAVSNDVKARTVAFRQPFAPSSVFFDVIRKLCVRRQSEA